MWHPVSQVVILCVRLQQNTINLFYVFMDILVFSYCNGVKLVMSVPLKTYERHFYMYKLITFHHKISNLDNYFQLTAEYDNLVLDDSNERFLLWKEADLKKCRGKGIMICPADKPIYGRNVLTCESSLYFQRETKLGLYAAGGYSRRNSPQYSSDTPKTGYTASATNIRWISSVARMQPGLLRPDLCKEAASCTTPVLAM